MAHSYCERPGRVATSWKNLAGIAFVLALSALSLSGSAAAAAASCQASTLPSYQHMQDLSGNGFILHWALPTASQLDIAVEAKAGSGAEKGWMSVGWSAEGMMAPADAVIGNMPGVAVGAFDISGYGGSTILASKQFKISRTQLTSTNGGSTFIKFTRTKGDGGVAPIDFTGKATNTIIWGYSEFSSKALDSHGNFKGSAKISFNCGGSSGAGAGNSTGAAGNSTGAAGNSTGAAGNSTGAAGNSTGAAGNSTGAAGNSTGAAGNSTGTGTGSSSSGSGSSTGTTNSSSSSAGGSGCTPSTIAGFSCSTKLSGDSYILHWKTNTSTSSIDFAAEVATAGWISLGFSADGKMYPADAAVGNNGSPTVAPYSISSYTSVSPTSSFALTATSVTTASNGKTVIKFSKTMSSGSYPISATGVTTLIWAYSADGTQSLANHGPNNRGSASIDFVSGATSVSSTSAPSTTFLIIHGLMLGIAFGILMPAAILISRIFLADKLHERPPGVDHDKWEAQVARAKSYKPMAFETHKWMQITAVVLAIAGCIFAFVQSGTVGLQSAHGQLGLAIFVLIFVQPLIGHFRPNKGTLNRPTWFVIHWVLGMGIVGMAWLNTFLGFDIMQTKFSYNLQWCYIIFGVTIALLGTIYVIIYVTDQIVHLISRFQISHQTPVEKEPV